MAALGLGLGVGDASGGDSSIAAVIEDYLWEIHTTAGAGNLTPLERSTTSDFHDTWDLTPPNLKPQTIASVGSEGYWVIGSAADVTDTNYIRPLDV